MLFRMNGSPSGSSDLVHYMLFRTSIALLRNRTRVAKMTRRFVSSVGIDNIR